MCSSPSNQKPTTMLADLSQITIPQGPFPTLSLPLSVSISTAKDLGSKHTLIILDPGFTLDIRSMAVGKSYVYLRLGFNSPNDRPANWKKTNSLDSHVPALRSPTWIRMEDVSSLPPKKCTTLVLRATSQVTGTSVPLDSTVGHRLAKPEPLT